MEATLFETLVLSLPNFVGLLLVAGALWKINNRLLGILERQLDVIPEKLEAIETDLEELHKNFLTLRRT